VKQARIVPNDKEACHGMLDCPSHHSGAQPVPCFAGFPLAAPDVRSTGANDFNNATCAVRRK